jgi:radical SAM protein with 4Fe4S-binding SPASM domain
MFMRGLIEAERNGFGWGLIYVVTKRSMRNPLDVFYFLTNLELSGGVNLNPVLIYDKERRDIAVTPQDYVGFLGDIFPAWWKHRHRYPNINPFKSLVENIIDGQTSLACCDSGSCAYSHVNIAPDGSTSQCGRSADWGLLSYGSIMERPLSEILKDPQRDELDHRVQNLFEGDCQNCRFWDLCHGGCPLDAYSKNKSFLFKSEWCDAKRGFITEHFEPVTGVHYEPKRRTRF